MRLISTSCVSASSSFTADKAVSLTWTGLPGRQMIHPAASSTSGCGSHAKVFGSNLGCCCALRRARLACVSAAFRRLCKEQYTRPRRHTQLVVPFPMWERYVRGAEHCLTQHAAGLQTVHVHFKVLGRHSMIPCLQCTVSVWSPAETLHLRAQSCVWCPLLCGVSSRDTPSTTTCMATRQLRGNTWLMGRRALQHASRGVAHQGPCFGMQSPYAKSGEWTHEVYTPENSEPDYCYDKNYLKYRWQEQEEDLDRQARAQVTDWKCCDNA